ncbi:Imm30 family immunity protein [Serratia ureilytica]|uniref:Imm30 family immunity protein n=1 Tax=Serratia ureilytica TaxID=300181 RepID=UPI001D185130|nr:Imm30 family immunity protein [Serratia ureilytica]MCC4104745.1 immunity 30 family protein [Serratia ureilytica]
MKQGCLEDLLCVRQLDSPDEVGVFDKALEGLSSEVLSKDDLVDLLSVFIDRTRNEEVMYGLLHLIEASDVNSVVVALMQAAPTMKAVSSDWLDTFIYRLLNGDYSRSALIEHLKQTGGTPGGAEITSRLAAIKDDASEKIRERASFVLSSLS